MTQTFNFNLTATLQLARLCVIACLVVCLPLQAASALVADMLGPRHTHTSFAAASLGEVADPLAGWRDFRRAQYDQVADMAELDAAHAHAHEIGAQHHHDWDDRSVIRKATGFEDAMSCEIAQATASLLFMAAEAAVQVPPPAKALGTRMARLDAAADPQPAPLAHRTPASRLKQQ